MDRLCRESSTPPPRRVREPVLHLPFSRVPRPGQFRPPGRLPLPPRRGSSPRKRPIPTRLPRSRARRCPATRTPRHDRRVRSWWSASGCGSTPCARRHKSLRAQMRRREPVGQQPSFSELTYHERGLAIRCQLSVVSYQSAHARSGNSQRNSLLRNVNEEAAAVQTVFVPVRTVLRAIFVSAAGIGPQAADFHLARACRHLRRLPPLFIHVSLDDLGRQPCRQFPVLAAFEQHTHDDVGIATRRESHEPSVLSELRAVLVL